MSTSATSSISLASLQGYFVSQLLGSAQTLQASGLSPLALSASAMSVASLSTQFQTSLVAALESLFSGAQSLYDAALPLETTQAGNYLARRTAISSDTGTLSATAADSATSATYTFKVTSVAAAQINLGDELDSDDTSHTGLSNGNKTFTLTVGGTTYSAITVNVASGQSFYTILTNLADAINGANGGNPGVTARVVTAGSGGAQTSRIEIVANETGTNYAFSLVDTSGTLIGFTGADTITTNAANGNYYLNDVYYSAQGNTVTLDSGKVIATLAGTSPNNVTLTVGPDSDTITSRISDFVDGFNSFVATLSANAPFLTPSLAAGVSRAVALVQADLSSIGITVNAASGALSLNSSTLSSAIDDDFAQVQRAIGGFSGLATQLAAQTNDVISSPISQFAASLPTLSSYDSIAPFIARYGTTSTLSLLLSGMLVNTRA